MSQSTPRQDCLANADDGWTRRFTAIGARLNEAIELYRRLGFEIKLEPSAPDTEEMADPSACAQCFVMTLAQTIYTRPLAVHASTIDAER